MEEENKTKKAQTLLAEENNTQTVGDILRHARLKQGKTLNDVAEVLCIRRVYLEAIENVEYKKLPVEPYGIGYVRNYAEYLGLNSARIVQSFKETAMPKSNNKKGLKAIGDEIDGNAPKFWHAVLGLFILFFAIVGWNFYRQQTEEPTVEIINETPTEENYPTPLIIEDEEYKNLTSTTENDAENIVETEIKTEEVIKQPSDDENITNSETLGIQTEVEPETIKKDKTETKSKLAEEDNTSPRIKIEVTGDSWIELKHGDKVLLAKVYHKGFEYEVPYNDNLIVSVGKRNNVKFYIDGKLTEVTTPRRQMRIQLDKFLEKR